MNTLLLAAVLLFPAVHGKTVAQRDYSLPRDLNGKAAIVVVIFGQHQQPDAESWLPQIQEIQRLHPELRYQVVSVSNFNDRLTRETVDAWMNFPITDPSAYENTVIVSTRRSRFMRALHLPSDQTVYTLLLDPSGYVRWRASGVMTPLHAAELKAAVTQLGQG